MNPEVKVKGHDLGSKVKGHGQGHLHWCEAPSGGKGVLTPTSTTPLVAGSNDAFSVLPDRPPLVTAEMTPHHYYSTGEGMI